MSREWLFMVTDMISCIEHIEKIVAHHGDAASLRGDMDAYRAAERNLEIIAEASKHIPEFVKADYAAVPWKKIVATRNIISHLYDGVDEDVIWSTLNKSVPTLKSVLNEILAKYENKR